MLKHGTEGEERTWGWLTTVECLTAATSTDLGEISNSGATVSNRGRGAVLGVRNMLTEQAGPSIYSDQQQWLRIWEKKLAAGERRWATDERYRGFHRGNVLGNEQATNGDLLRRGNTPKYVAQLRRRQSPVRTPQLIVQQVGTVNSPVTRSELIPTRISFTPSHHPRAIGHESQRRRGSQRGFTGGGVQWICDLL
jgi:hypothetical protein